MNDEGRSYLTRLAGDQDIIQISLADTWAATAAGAYALTENALYTVDAWKIFVGKLSSRGILSVSRWVDPVNPSEVYRLVSLGTATLLELGVPEPAPHMMLVWNTVLINGERAAGTLLLGREPFSKTDVETIRALSHDLNFEAAFLAGATEDPELAALTSRQLYAKAVDRFKSDVAAPTDDRPFFFQTSRLSDLWHPEAWHEEVSRAVTDPTYLLGVLFLMFLGLNLFCIFIPRFPEERRGSGGAPYGRWSTSPQLVSDSC